MPKREAEETPMTEHNFDPNVPGAIGDPNGYRYVTGGRNVDVTGDACEMLRNRHRGDKDE